MPRYLQEPASLRRRHGQAVVGLKLILVGGSRLELDVSNLGDLDCAVFYTAAEMSKRGFDLVHAPAKK